MAALLRSAAEWTPRALAKSREHTGKKSGQLAGSYVSDLASLRKAITLCVSCAPKFSAANHGYVTDRSMPLCVARCDGCKEVGPERRLFLHQQNMPRL